LTLILHPKHPQIPLERPVRKTHNESTLELARPPRTSANLVETSAGQQGVEKIEVEDKK
jgi:hypothetical protein